MPSNDSRYSNAHGDISCHLRFGDYEDEYWIFQDERFSLRQGDGDEALLHFYPCTTTISHLQLYSYRSTIAMRRWSDEKDDLSRLGSHY